MFPSSDPCITPGLDEEIVDGRKVVVAQQTLGDRVRYHEHRSTNEKNAAKAIGEEMAIQRTSVDSLQTLAEEGQKDFCDRALEIKKSKHHANIEPKAFDGSENDDRLAKTTPNVISNTEKKEIPPGLRNATSEAGLNA